MLEVYSNYGEFFPENSQTFGRCSDGYKRQINLELETMTIKESESNPKAGDDSSCLLLEEDCVKDDPVALSSLPSSGTLRQHPESSPSTSTQNETRRKEEIEVRFNHNTLSPVARIFEVVARGDHEALSVLLTIDKTSVCTIDSKGNTALHRAVASACRKGDWDDSLYQCIDPLMSCEQMNINMPNKKVYTPIGLAVRYLHKTCVEFMLKHPSAKRLHLDYNPGDSESTVREIILQTYPDLEPHLPEPLLERLDSSERNIKLLAALQIDKFNIFSENLDLNNHNPWYDEPYHSSLLEIACQMKNRKKFVELLLHNGAGPNVVNSVTGMPLIHATARSGNFELLELLLRQGKVDASVTDNKNKTILHWLASVSGKNPGDRKRLDRCFKLVLDFCENKIIDWRDDEGSTALYVAVKNEFKDRVLLLLKRGADITLFIHGTPILSSVSTPMLKAIHEDYLECNNKSEKSEDLNFIFSYEIRNKIEPHILKCLHEREFLKHPVTSRFTSLKFMAGYSFVLITFALTIFIAFKGSSKEGDTGDLSRSFHSLRRAPIRSETEFHNINFVTLSDIIQIIFFLIFFLASIILLKFLNALAMLDAK